MKELSIEEKAHRYDEAIEMAKEYFDSPRTCIDINVLPKLFPELKESEDERIRKELIETVHLAYDCECSLTKKQHDNYIAYLEKQGGQKSVGYDFSNKEYWRGYKEGKQCVEDKYKEQKPVEYNVNLIKSEIERRINCFRAEKDKEGACEVDNLSLGGRIAALEELLSFINTLPQQRLVEWSEEDNVHINNIINRTKAFGDSSMFGLIQDDIDWLKSLKNRCIPQPKQEWSKKNKYMVDSLLDVLYRIKDGKDVQATNRLIESHINFLKSLRPQKRDDLTDEEKSKIWRALNKTYAVDYRDKLYNKIITYYPQKQWKPSGEQITALAACVGDNKHNTIYSALHSLYEQLKVL